MSELRVAVFSDVHGNLPALEATLAEIERRGPWYRVIAAGDHCLSGPDPLATLERVLERATDVLQGNTDRDIVDSGASDPELGDKKRAAIAWTRGQLGAQGTATLDTLPFEARVTAPDGSSLLVVHANPRDLDQHIFPDMPAAQLRALLESAKRFWRACCASTAGCRTTRDQPTTGPPPQQPRLSRSPRRRSSRRSWAPLRVLRRRATMERSSQVRPTLPATSTSSGTRAEGRGARSVDRLPAGDGPHHRAALRRDDGV